MIPVRIFIKGFMSYREEAELLFDGAPLWVLSGRNGTGKSAVFDAIMYALFGVHRAGKANAKVLINNDSSGLVVEYDFAIGEKIFRAKRTLPRRGKGTVQLFGLRRTDDGRSLPRVRRAARRYRGAGLVARGIRPRLQGGA